ncbi:MAG TPA: hypothetical protein VNA24_24285 [Hyalangium sp.]|nr:hypothetical protein [Hyalangium sp.]
MSEYQYYEFRAVDRPLTDQEQAELRKLSTRAEISAYHFSNVYHWGNFKGSPDEMVERYFDAHLYVTNWGVRRLMLRLPARLFDAQRARLFLTGSCLSLREKGDTVVLTFATEEAWSDDIQGEGWLASLLPLRNELLAGDTRALYLGWLACAAHGQLSADDEEPPVPMGLRSLSAALVALTDFLLIPQELLEVAARASPAAEIPGTRAELETWVYMLPAPQKDALLLRLIDKAGPSLSPEVLGRDSAKAEAPRRMVGELLRAGAALQQQRERQEQLRRAAAREKELDALAARGSAAWEQVEQLFATRRPKDHAAGVRLLVDLREVAQRQGTEAEFIRRLGQLRERNARRAGLISRMNKEGLSAP